MQDDFAEKVKDTFNQMIDAATAGKDA